MGLSYSYDGDVLRIVGEGNYSVQALKDLLTAAMSDPRTRPGMSTLMDIRQSEATRTTEELVSVVDFLGSKRDRSVPLRCAVVAAGDLRFGLSRMVSVYVEKYGVELRVFRDLESAEFWLRADSGA
jgi:hypothetical protein